MVSANDTLKVLLSETTDLYQLAKLTGMNPSTFYEGADLRGVDLSGQDLRGLVFSRADLRTANLSETTYDEGAFNGSKLSSEQMVFVDHYDFSYSDIISLFHVLPGLYIFLEFRGSTLDTILEFTNKPYWMLAKEIGINIATLRKARSSYTVSRETAVSIIEYLEKIAIPENDLFGRRPGALWYLPAVQLLELSPNGGFYSLSRSALLDRFKFLRGELGM